MTNQGGEYIVELDSNSVEKRQIVDVSQGNASTYASLNPGHYSWPSSTGPVTVSWNFHRADNNSVENGTPSSSSYHYDTQREVTASRDAQDGISAAPHASTSSSQGAANATQNYGAYASYSNSTNPYGYYNSEYQNYYYGYQTPASDPSSQQVGASQNSGAPYQSLSSFQNTGSYAGPASYSDTYYNTGDHQTMGGYQSSSYNQTNLWNDGNCGSYPLPYSNYTSSDTNSIQSTSTVSANSIHYQQQYNQWPEHHSSTAPNFGCAPGTENTSMTTTTAVECPVQSVGGGYPYPYPTNQPPPPGTTSWRTDSGSSGLPSIQGKNDVTGYNLNDGWKVGAPGFQNHHINQMASHFQKPLDSNPLPHDICGDQQNQLYPQGSSLQFSSINQVPENFQPPLQTAPLLDTPRVSKMQIQTNPRIASSLAFGMPKTDKESSTTNTALKPAYVSIASPNLNSKVSSHDDSEAMMKVTFPPSLRTYVERTLARCKDDVQRAANQNIMKEMITKASGDGTLFTRNWDMEPLFPLPNTTSDMVDQNNLQTSGTLSSLPKYKRSPSRRTKSRWEPMPEEKLVEKLSLVNHDSAKDVTLGRFKETERMADSGKSESKDNGWNGMKFLPSQQQAPSSKIAHRPVKKQRFGEISNLPENGDASSDSDKEQGLTKYYSSAITLANSPEEKKKREYRFKRFEKVQVHQTEIQHFRPKVPGAGNICTRRASTAQLAKRYEDGCSRAVEDIDWDALTVKGTCQEVEKRYLRLTSAPDPATVRPEEVLEKALQMVQSSQKNYLYKCDQLKSIRQDLTVQRIQNELTVKVYETHARLALEAGDLPEYNQCQSKLKSLYAEGIKGCHMEFSAYHLLCIILHSSNNGELLSSMTRLSTEAKKDEAIKHALAVRTAVSSGNYILFFRLYKMAPNLNTCLMDLYVEKMRFEAVRCLSKSYRPTVPLTFIAQVLGFSRAVLTDESEETDKDGLEECEEWLRAHGANLVVDNNGEMQLDTKVTSSSLYMPDPEDAVAHGDTTLAVDDFLTRTS